MNEWIKEGRKEIKKKKEMQKLKFIETRRKQPSHIHQTKYSFHAEKDT